MSAGIATRHLEAAINAAEERAGREFAQNPRNIRMIDVVMAFLRARGCVCYGGTAINNLLPRKVQFYNFKGADFPDFDFYSDDALQDAIWLSDTFKNTLGYKNVEVKQGIHGGTFKVFVEYTGVADITGADKVLFARIKAAAIKVDGILYAPPDFLRMNMYLELSRPAGDVSRWKKVFHRLELLNQYYPMKLAPGVKCGLSELGFTGRASETDEKIAGALNQIICDTNPPIIIGFQCALFYRNPRQTGKEFLEEISHRRPMGKFYALLAEDAGDTADSVTIALQAVGCKNIISALHPPEGEILPMCIEVGGPDLPVSIFIYKTEACHSYYPLRIGTRYLRVASMDTIINFYLAAALSNRAYYDISLLRCQAKYYVDLSTKLRNQCTPPIPPFAMNCLGHQPVLIDLQQEKRGREMRFAEGIRQGEHLKHGTESMNDTFFATFIPPTVKEAQLPTAKLPQQLSNLFKTPKAPTTTARKPGSRKSHLRKT